jgi:hypothetical protein
MLPFVRSAKATEKLTKDKYSFDRIWESLGFTKAGRIPAAGRLKKDENGEEFVDAWVFYKSFTEP